MILCKNSVSLLLFLSTLAALTLADDDWTAHCSRCKCMWSNGKKWADCRAANLNEIPRDLSPELRDIDFSNNPLYELRAREFAEAGLHDTHKLRLQNCSLEAIHYLAFYNLRLLIELDLSNNNIKKLDGSLFKDAVKLRMLYLSHNKLRRLEKSMFENMNYLQKVHLDNNELEVIDEDVFGVNCSVMHLALENNKLTTMSPTFGHNLIKLGSINLLNNPWFCDCRLNTFRKLAIESFWITGSPQCELPERLKGRKWTDNVIFACNPKIIEPSSNAVLEVDSVNFTVPCRVEGDPRPSVVWYVNGRSVDVQRNPSKYVMTTSADTPYWFNLTIVGVTYRDKGEYKCVATNAASSDEKNVTVYLRGTDYMGGGALSSTSMSNTMILIITLSIGAVVLLAIIILLICCCCKRPAGTGRDPKPKNRNMSQDEFISMDGRPSDMEKALISDVNPVSKPPRQYSVPPSITSGGTEVSETKKMIDDESIFNGDDDSRAYDYIGRPQQQQQVHRPAPASTAHLGQDYSDSTTGGYPPDLLAFPPRPGAQISPAGSSASTVMVVDQQRPSPFHHHHGPVSPGHHHPYDIYRTLPYSRSHSPFVASPTGVGGGAYIPPPVRIPRQSAAYVTIPRRPRASWSSEPPGMGELNEPIYDNLGLRTTATGASVLSLNKKTPCKPISEIESQTLPRNMKSNYYDWSRSPDCDSRRDSTASLIPSSDGKPAKVPPRPPPKPKKRVSAGPLFEDEGEDGTEV